MFLTPRGQANRPSATVVQAPKVNRPARSQSNVIQTEFQEFAGATVGLAGGAILTATVVPVPAPMRIVPAIGLAVSACVTASAAVSSAIEHRHIYGRVPRLTRGLHR